MNPYRDFVASQVRCLCDGKALPLGGLAPAPRPDIPGDAPRVLLFSPHPDDECVIGALPLRLVRQARMKVVNVAVTQGSNKARQAGRLEELRAACQFLGFDLIQTVPNGLERVSLKTREQDPGAWQQMVRVIADILVQQQPKAVFFPHDRDWNSTHIGVHWMVMDALAAVEDMDCFLIETEFWAPVYSPNLMVESTEEEVADLVAATSLHVGEVKRNPYHVLLPVWMMDNTRRGSEVVGGQGQAAPDFLFSTLYRMRRFARGRIENVLPGNVILKADDDPANLFRP